MTALTQAQSRDALRRAVGKNCANCDVIFYHHHNETVAAFHRRQCCNAKCAARLRRGNIYADFEAAYIPEPNSGCYLWERSVNSWGYGRFRLDGGTAAHRASWCLYRGPIPVGKHILHRCDNPPCVNPDHLFLGDNQSNTDDKVMKGRASSMPGESNPMARLQYDQIEAIRIDTRPQHVIAKDFGVSQSLVSLVKLRRIWVGGEN